MKINSNEIARLANVSRATVHRVVNNQPNVKDETREKVQAIIDKFDYKPNIAGKALVKQRYTGTIGIILPEIKNDFYRQVKKGLDAAYSEHQDMGFKVIYKYMKGFTVQDQLEAIEYMRHQNISALALVAIDNKDIEKALNSIADHTLIVTFISDIKNIKKLCFVGNKLEKSGRVASELISKLINNNGNVAIISTGLNLLAHKERIKGFKNKIKEKRSNIKIIDISENYDNDDRTYQIVERLLNEKELDAIYMTTGLGTRGLGDALKKYDKENRIRVVTCDLTSNTTELLREDIVDFTICQDPFQEGYKPLKVIFDSLLKNERPLYTEIKTNIDIKSWENIN